MSDLRTRHVLDLTLAEEIELTVALFNLRAVLKKSIDYSDRFGLPELGRMRQENLMALESLASKVTGAETSIIIPA